MDELVKLERQIQGIYDRTMAPLAERLGFELPTSSKDAPGLPSVLFLGNHSSGKSSFINHILGTPLQKSGLAPTDDGFTIITFGERQDEFDGQTVVTHPELAYRNLQRLGPAFLSRLRLKTYPHEVLKSITLIDSPGMIDAAGDANTRGYDFSASVRYFAETADLILFFFDPDKPGTTGETVSIFTQTLAGLEYKLLIIMNKVDLFQNIRDFARTYGTLCWNLSKTIKTKDIPHIYNTYLPNQAQRGPDTQRDGAVPLHDFDLSREEVIAQVRRTPTRRADNLVSDLYNNARKLDVHARVSFAVVNAYRSLRNKFWALLVTDVILTAALVWFLKDRVEVSTLVWISLSGLVLGAGIWMLMRYLLGQFKERALTESGIHQFFERAFHRELGLGDRADLRALWIRAKPQTLKALRVLGIERFGTLFSGKRAVRRLEQVVQNEIPGLRRSIAEHYKALRDKSTEDESAVGNQ